MRRLVGYSGVAAVAVTWITLLTASAVASLDLLGDRPLSDLGARPASRALFAAGLAVPAILMAHFHQVVRRRFPVSTGFSAAMLGGLAGQMVAAFVPIGGSPAVHRIHTWSALLLGASLPVLMWRFAAAQPPGRWRTLAYGLFWAEAGACVAGLYLSARSIAPLAEILPGAVFHVWVLTVTAAAVTPVLTRGAVTRGMRRLTTP